MIATTGAYQTMAESLDQVPDYRVTITLPGGVYPDLTLGVKHLEINASTSSDVPEQSRFQVGYPAMECTFTLAGLVDQRDESKTAAWLFGKYPTAASDGTTSPLYQQFVEQSPVTVDLGLQPAGTAGVSELLRKFTGTVAYYQENADGTVDFTCIDSRALLKSVPTIPPVVTAPPYNAGLTSEFAVDALLRAATGGTISSWPAQRPSCLLAVGLRSSLWPEVGALVGTGWNAGLFGDALVPTFTPGLMGTALVPNNGVMYNLASSVGTDSLIEVWTGSTLLPPIDLTTASGLDCIRVYATFTTIQLQHFSNGLVDETIDTGIPITNARRIRVLHHQVIGSTSWSATVQTASGGTFSTGTRTAANARLGAYTTARANDGGSFEAWQVTAETVMPPNDTFTPLAQLDQSLNPLTVVPPISGDPWQTVQQIADAEFAVAGFDESGIFRFKNRNTLRGAAPSRTVTSTMALRALGVEATTASVINRAQIPYTTYNFAASPSTVFSLDAATVVPRASTVTIAATVDTLFANLDASISKLPNGSVDTTHSFYRASTTKAGSSEHPGITFGAIVQTSATELAITVTNPTGQDAWLVSPANYTDVPVGTPLLRLAAKAVTPANELIADYQYPPLAANGTGGAKTTRWGEVAYQPSSNPWLQDPNAATQLAQDIVVDSCIPRPNLNNVSIIPDPRLQLSDVVHIVDSDRTGVDEYARIFAWTLSYEAGGDGGDMTYEMSIDARTLSAPGGWIMGYAGRSEIGSTAYVYG